MTCANSKNKATNSCALHRRNTITHFRCTRLGQIKALRWSVGAERVCQEQDEQCPRGNPESCFMDAGSGLANPIQRSASKISLPDTPRWENAVLWTSRASTRKNYQQPERLGHRWRPSHDPARGRCNKYDGQPSHSTYVVNFNPQHHTNQRANHLLQLWLLRFAISLSLGYAFQTKRVVY